MSYISLSDKDKKDMLARIGASSIHELFRSIPDSIKLGRDLEVPGPLSEPELSAFFEKIARKNRCSDDLSFLGAGAYDHLVPAVVDSLSSRGEFISPYTPYQAELSQGTLQVIFEFQTLVCQLTGLDIANASLYEGASAAAEAVLMAHRLKGRPRVLVARTLHPQYRQVIRTYIKNLGLEAEEVKFTPQGTTDLEDLEGKLDAETTAVVVQSPNFFGVIEDLRMISAAAHAHQALSVAVVAEPVSLGILEAPGDAGADIVSGEAQAFGMYPAYGGPFLGFMACRMDFIRQFPGRIAGETKDTEGRRGFVLTLSTREQHIRRERATSNICTNQAWCALRATIFLETLGKEGLRELAWLNVQKAGYARRRLERLKGVTPKFRGPVFNEFVLDIDRPWGEIETKLREEGILGGLPLGESYPELPKSVLICVTEKHSRSGIDRLAEALEKALV